MADSKITDLADGGALQDADKLVVARAGANYSVKGSGLKGVLAVAQYAPGARQTYTFNTSALTAFDTTNLTISLTVPASGKVIVQATLNYDTGAGATQSVILGLLNHTGGAQVGSSFIVSDGVGSQSAKPVIATWYLTGLTPGALQLDLAGYCGGTAHLYVKDFTGITTSEWACPCTIVAWAA